MNKNKQLINNINYCNCVIISTNITEYLLGIQTQMETMLNNEDELYFLIYKTQATHFTIGNTFMGLSKINNGKLQTEKEPEIIIEHKQKELITVTGLLIKNITDNLVLNRSNCKFLENTKKNLHLDCPAIKKRQTTTLNYVLTSTARPLKKPNIQLLFYIITLWNQTKLFFTDAAEFFQTNSISAYTAKPATSLDVLHFLKNALIGPTIYLENKQ